MKKILFGISVLLFPVIIFSQPVFQNITFQEALNSSAQTGRLIFLQFESATCSQCNEVANKAFEDKKLSSNLEQTFICIKITPEHSEREKIGTLYNVKKSFGSFFIDHTATLIHSYNKSTTLAAAYTEQIGIALFKASEGVKISDLEKEYREGDKGVDMLQALLLKRKSLTLDTDSLLDVYISTLPPDSLQSVTALTFIAKMAPMIGSNADNQLRKDYTLFNKAWYAIPLAERININGRIIYKSINKAVSEKNEVFAYRVATFSKSTYTNNAQAGEKSFDKIMLDFFYETKDTFNYLVKAVNYYDKYYMTVSVDDISKQDSLLKVNLLANAKGDTTFKTGSTRKITKHITFSPQTSTFSQALNTGAWNFYTMSNDTMFLNKALQWAKRAVEFYESPEAMDTYARLLYKSNEKEEAIFWELKTITLRQKRGYPVVEFEAVLNKMKTGAAIID